MPAPLVLAATANTYTDAATFTPQPTGAVSVQISNATVDYSITTRRDGVVQGNSIDRPLLPGPWVFREGLDWQYGEQLVSIAFKSHALNTPAIVSATAQ